MPSVTPDEQDPALQGCKIHMYSADGTQLQTGEKVSFTITPPLTPSSDQIFARIAVSRMVFTYDSQAYTFTLSVTDSTLYSFALGALASAWVSVYF
jgi:hypothetical protein